MNIVNIVHIAMEIWGSVFCLVATVCVALRCNLDSKERSLILGLQLEAAILLIADAAAWGFRGNPTNVGYVAVRLSNFVVFITSYIILITYTAYLQYDIKKRTGETVRVRVAIIYLASLLSILMIVITQFNGLIYTFDAQNFYHRSDLFWISQAEGVVGGVLNLSIILQYRKSLSRLSRIAYLSYVFIPLVALIIQIFFYGIALFNIAVAIAVLCMFVVSVIEQEQYANQLQIEVMMSQIGEHFIFNSLATIKNLCHTNPADAEQAVVEFSKYLRGNIDAVGSNRLIPFAQELEHVQNYLLLEHRRYGERLAVTYEIETEDFELPPLTLQPLVENAVKHGVTQKIEGGTIVIATRELKNDYEILVKDDGVGFDVNEKKDDGRRHIGMENVAARVGAMCNGVVQVESVEGEGTTVRVFIKKPKRGRHQ